MNNQRTLQPQVLSVVGMILIQFLLGGCATISSNLQDAEESRILAILPTFTPTPIPAPTVSAEQLDGNDAETVAAWAATENEARHLR